MMWEKHDAKKVTNRLCRGASVKYSSSCVFQNARFSGDAPIAVAGQLNSTAETAAMLALILVTK